jgi:hypothetical protein
VKRASLGRDVGQGVEVVDCEAERSVVELERARADEALVPELARPAVDQDDPFLL